MKNPFTPRELNIFTWTCVVFAWGFLLFAGASDDAFGLWVATGLTGLGFAAQVIKILSNKNNGGGGVGPLRPA